MKKKVDVNNLITRIRYSPIYAPVFQHQYQHNYLPGGRYRGGSRVAADKAIIHGLTRSSHFLFLRYLQKSIAMSNFGIVARLIHEYELDDYFKIGKTEIVSRLTECKYSFLGTKMNIESILSYDNVGGVHYEEPQKMTQSEVFGRVNPSIRPQDGGPRHYYYSWNHTNPDDDIENRRRNLGPNDICIFGTYRDNAFLPDYFWDDLEECRILTPWLEDHIFNGQWHPIKGAVFFMDELKPIPHNEGKTLKSSAGADCAGSEQESADRTALTKMSKVEHELVDFVIEDCWFGRVNSDARHRKIREFAEQWGTGVKWSIELNASSERNKAQLKKDYAETMQGYSWSEAIPTGSKEMRFDPWARVINSGRVGYRLNEDGTNPWWLSEFTREHAGFPDAAKHDDIPDSATYAYLNLQSSGSSIEIW